MERKHNLYIVPNAIKKESQQTDDNLNNKYITREEFINNLSYQIKPSAYLYMMRNYNYSYTNSKIILKNILYYPLLKLNISKKVNELYNLFNELISLNHITYDDEMYNYYRTFNIKIKNYQTVDKLFKYYLDKFIDYEILDEAIKNTSINVYEYHHIREEIESVMNKVAILLDQKISAQKIKIVSASSTYNYLLIKNALLYNINLELDKPNLLNSKIVTYFLNNINKYTDKSDLIEDIKVNFIITQNLQDDLKKLVKILLEEDIDNLTDAELKEILVAKGGEETISSYKLDNSIEVINPNSFYPLDDVYYFVIGFNQDIIPKTYKDNDYLNDYEKESIQIEKSEELNKQSYYETHQKLIRTKHLEISYSLENNDQELYPSSLLNEKEFSLKTPETSNIHYSRKLDQLKLSAFYDELIKYNNLKDETIVLHNNYQIPYLTYSNKYSLVNQKLKYPFKLSFSSIDTFSKCRFRYYLEYILGLNKMSETINIKIGNIFHLFLSTYQTNESFHADYKAYLQTLDLTNKERVLLLNLEDELANIILLIKKQDKHISLKSLLVEEKISINLNDKFILKGIIDKIYYQTYSDETYVSIIDYKTGKKDITIDNIEYGLNMQLFIYLYLLIKSKMFNKIVVSGVYFQELLSQVSKMEYDDDYNSLREDSLKLKGYSNSDLEILEQFDETYESSNIIKSLRLKKDGTFYGYSKVLTSEEFDNILLEVEKYIQQMIDLISQAKYEINPIILNGNDVSCSYCEYNDICFKEYLDYQIINNKGGSNSELDE